MKKLAVLIFVFAMSVTSTFANDEDDKRKGEKALRTQIVKLLGNYESKETVEAEVKFMINRKGEIIVLSVESKNKNVDAYIKSALNYKTVTNKVAKRMKMYIVPLKIVKA